MPKKRCKVLNCNRLIFDLGYCEKHTQQQLDGSKAKPIVIPFVEKEIKYCQLCRKKLGRYKRKYCTMCTDIVIERQKTIGHKTRYLKRKRKI